ncbi:MAG: 5'(3')-deoxyribonucleotidase [Flavobacteriales bacterium CG_4_9_14_3_um_filter_40_17]|nr:MAG: 5'(3')-deoxyribonucleotidase [Flavobacteriales bacterium CG_4_9_14_3_um_filter_40_17]
MTLFVDMDEVIADTYGAHIDRYNKDYQENLTREFCMGHEVWQCVPENRQQSIQNHPTLEGFFSALKPMKDSQSVMKELSLKYEVYIASAAMEHPKSLIEKYQWIDEHFPFIHWKKRILCGDKHILSGDILIDDRVFNLEPFQGRSLMFTSPHNIHEEGFERVNNWMEIAEKLL